MEAPISRSCYRLFVQRDGAPRAYVSVNAKTMQCDNNAAKMWNARVEL